MTQREAEDTPPLTGLVLCGGHSRRMGSDKALLVVLGERLVDRAVRRLKLVADPVLLAAGARPLTVRGCGAVEDAAPDAGPLGGIVAGLRASPHPLTAVVAVDMPWIDPTLLARLAEACASGVDAAVPVSDGRPQPLHAVYSRSALPLMEEALHARRLRLHDVVGSLRVRCVDAGAARYAANVNTPADLLTLAEDRPEAG